MYNPHYNELFEFIERYMPLTGQEKEAIVELDLFKNYTKKTILLREGEYSNKSYYVARGCLRSYYIIDGEEKTTAFYTEGEAFEPPCCVTGKPSDLFVSCVEDCILSIATTAMQEEIFAKFPRIESLCRLLSEDRLADNQTFLADFMTSSPEQRYLNLLKTRPDLPQRVPQYQLASYLGITPESLSRIRRRLAGIHKS